MAAPVAFSERYLRVDHPPRPSVDYSRYTISDLRQFASNRGVEVTTNGNPSRLLLHSDYIDALKHDDETATFRFLDLPGELRNLIYEYLLTIDEDSFEVDDVPTTCYPQILLSCKEIQNEATSILYADNFIFVWVYPDGVEAHGSPCGTHMPAICDPESRAMSTLKPSAIQWPGFLRRARKIMFQVPDRDWQYGISGRVTHSITSAQREAAINNVFYSFCSMLGSNSCCQMLYWDPSDIVGSGWTETDFRTCYYPIRLLGPEWERTGCDDFGVIYSRTARHGEVFRRNETISARASGLSKRMITPNAALLREAIALVYKVCRCWPSDWRRSLILVLGCLATISSAVTFLLGLRVFTGWARVEIDKELRLLIDELRYTLSYRERHLPTGIRKEIQELLLLEVEVHAARVIEDRASKKSG